MPFPSRFQWYPWLDWSWWREIRYYARSGIHLYRAFVQIGRLTIRFEWVRGRWY